MFRMSPDTLMPALGVSSSPVVSLALSDKSMKKDDDSPYETRNHSLHISPSNSSAAGDSTRHRNLLLEGVVSSTHSPVSNNNDVELQQRQAWEQQQQQQQMQEKREQSWRRMLLLIVAITVHNIPEGLAVGVGFGAVGKTSSASFSSARSLAIAIGIQNFPEGWVELGFSTLEDNSCFVINDT